ncbi:MAG: carbohydrate ABC transporter permease [Firmicutes bacterium]|nr:carbohydrate ABC transporter permease [Bacillota bacterium]
MKKVFQTIVVTLFALFWLVISFYPFVFMVMSSLKGRMEFVIQPKWALPEKFLYTNYIRVIEGGFLRFFSNSVIVSGFSVLLIILVSSLSSYAISRIRFRFSGFVYTMFVAGMMIPIHITLIPVYNLTRAMGLYDNLAGLVGPYVSFSLPVSVFVLTGFMREIPLELEEAALMDGASRLQVYTKVIMPLSKPAISTVAIYNFIMLWNEFIYALVLLSSPKNWNLTMGLWNFHGQYSIDIPLIMATLTLAALPLIIVYIFLQEQVIRGMTTGALKG